MRAKPDNRDDLDHLEVYGWQWLPEGWLCNSAICYQAMTFTRNSLHKLSHLD